VKPFRIALLGDGTFAAWQNAPELQAELSRLFSQTQFEIDNHALAGCRAGHALWCLTNDYADAAGNKRTCVSNGNYNLVLIDSFALTDSEDDVEGLTEYRDILRRVWEEIESTCNARRIFHLAPPPDRDRYGDTARRYRNVSKATRARHADRVRLYLEEASRIAADEEWPVADCFMDVMKMVEKGDRLRRFVNQADCLTPSRYGFENMARVIVRAIDSHRLYEEKAAH
jgi:hypothetical protein